MTIYVECPKRPMRTIYDEYCLVHGHECDVADRPTPPGPMASKREMDRFAKDLAVYEDLMRRQKAFVMPPRTEPVFLCGQKVEQTPFCACGHTAEMLCDYPMGKGETCDLPLCWCCRRHIGEDRDLCEIHFAEFVGKARVGRINPWPPKRGA